MRVLILLSFLAGTAALTAAQEESLRIAAHDSVQIKVLEAPELSESARVSDAGTVPLIVGGEVKLGGLTPAEASRAIEATLRNGNYLLTPHVTVSFDESTYHNVTILGQVHVPGSYALGTPRPVLEALSLAGGLTDVANRQITIQRRATHEMITYFVPNDLRNLPGVQVYVYPGDTVLAPKAGIVYMLGDFSRPGGYVINTNDSRMSMLQAMTIAGGTPPNAVPSHARLLRKQPDGTVVELALNLSQMQKGKTSDLPLQPDDVVYVPFSYMRNVAVSAGSLLAATGSAAIYRF